MVGRWGVVTWRVGEPLPLHKNQPKAELALSLASRLTSHGTLTTQQGGVRFRRLEPALMWMGSFFAPPGETRCLPETLYENVPLWVGTTPVALGAGFGVDVE